MIVTIAPYLQKNGKYSGPLKKTITDLVQAIKDILSINEAFKEKVLQTDTTINFNNGTLHIDKKTGETFLKKHAHTDYTLSCSPHAFTENTDCPLFDTALHQIFQKAEQPDELVEFIYEVIGYILSGIRT